MSEKLPWLYYSVIVVLTVLGYLVFWKMRSVYSVEKVQIRKDRYNQLQNIVQERMNDETVTQLFTDAGFKFSSIQYQFIRYIFHAIWLVSSIAGASMKGGGITEQLIIIALFFLVSSPRTHLFNRRTPFKMLMDLAMESFRYKKNLEIFRAISQLKNLATIKQKNPPGSLYILEQLRKFTNTTKPIFNNMIAMWTMDQKDEACDYFKKAINTREAEEVADLIRKLDTLKPAELKNQLTLFQEIIKRDRETQKLKANQVKSYVIYSIVVVSVLFIFINFMVIGFVIDFMDQLHNLY